MKNSKDDFGDWAFNRLKEIVISSSTVINKKKFSNQITRSVITFEQEDLDKVQIVQDKEYVGDGDKCILVVGDLMFSKLLDSYRLESVLNLKFDKSFEQFLDNQISAAVSILLMENLNNSLDEERKATKKPKPKKN